MDIVTTYSSFKPCLNKCISFDDNNKLCLSLFKLFLGHQGADILPEFLNQTRLTLKWKLIEVWRICITRRVLALEMYDLLSIDWGA